MRGRRRTAMPAGELEKDQDNERHSVRRVCGSDRDLLTPALAVEAHAFHIDPVLRVGPSALPLQQTGRQDSRHPAWASGSVGEYKHHCSLRSLHAQEPAAVALRAAASIPLSSRKPTGSGCAMSKG